MAWIDSHTHINDEAFNDDLNEVLKRMKDADIKKTMLVSLNEEDYKRSLNIKDDDLIIDYALGVYPGDVATFSRERILEIYKLYSDPRIKAIGEIGLDYHWQKDNKEAQKAVFIEQLKMAQELNKPVIIHSRDAVQDTYDILSKYPVRGVMHCYSDSKEMAKEFIKLGMYISFSGTITFKNAKEPKEVLKVVPLDRLLIETDAPYLAPVPHRGKRNEPSFVKDTGIFIADELQMSKEKLQAILNENYDRLFYKK